MNKTQRTIEQQGRRDRAAYNLRMCLINKRNRRDCMFYYFFGKYEAYSIEAGHYSRQIHY